MTPIKDDAEKLRFDLLPVEAIEEITRALTYGGKKYADNNYREGGGLQWHRLFRATIGHLFSFWRNEDLDSESGLHHLAHAGASLLMLFQLVLENNGSDTRYKRGN